MRKPRRVKLAGRWWRLVWQDEVKSPDYPKQKLLGLCEYKTKTIHIKADQEAKDLSETFLHESLHALFPFLNEESVEVAAEELNNALWSAGIVTDE